jgi:hypothetical protein
MKFGEKSELMLNFATAAAYRASASVFIRFDENQKLSVTFIEFKAANNQLF